MTLTGQPNGLRLREQQFQMLTLPEIHNPMAKLDNSSPQSWVIAHSPALEQHPWFTALAEVGRTRIVDTPKQLLRKQIAVVVVDSQLLLKASYKEWRQATNAILVAVDPIDASEFDLLIDQAASIKSVHRQLKLACKQWALQRQCNQAQRQLNQKHKDIGRLTEIGIALSSEHSLDKLLKKILTEGERLSSCDAASLFLMQKDVDGHRQLIFKLTDNQTIKVAFKEQTLEIDDSSLVGYVVSHNKALNINDVYQLADDSPYHFNRSFDKETGYRTVSMFAIPITNHNNEVIGALEFINRKDYPNRKLNNSQETCRYVRPFDEHDMTILRALAGQAAVALENQFLVDSINQLFDGFVQASITAIEQRDPTTSGHSFRVAEYCMGLAKALPMSPISKFNRITFAEDELRELRFAALLHDFGKVGVREHVLTKAKKLYSDQHRIIQYRIALAKERTLRKTLENLDTCRQQHAENSPRLIELEREMFRQNAEELDRLDHYWQAIDRANEPHLLAEGDYSHLKEIHGYHFDDEISQQTTLLSDAELRALSTLKGSLTDRERQEIESHVTHTQHFLAQIPWTKELAKIPTIAGAHHEKLDGSGYPKGLTGSDIPLASQIMTVCDIYDALTAADRPYKRAIPHTRALDIICREAKYGKMDRDLVQVFIDAQVHLNTTQQQAAKPPEPCDHLYCQADHKGQTSQLPQ